LLYIALRGGAIRSGRSDRRCICSAVGLFIGANVELHAGGSGATMEKTEGRWEAEDVIFQEL
jgi:hypothetical protein